MDKGGWEVLRTQARVFLLKAPAGRQHLFPWLVGSFCAGSILGSLDIYTFLWPLLAFVALALWFFLAIKGPKKGPMVSVALLCFLALGAWNHQRLPRTWIQETFLYSPFIEEQVELEGLIVETPRLHQKGVRFHLQVHRLKQDSTHWNLQTLVLIMVREGGYELKYGDLIRTRLRLRCPEPPLNPGDIDTSRRLLRQGVTLVGSVSDDNHILIIGRGRGTFGLQTLEDVRYRLTHLVRTQLPAPSRDILLALIVGQAGVIDQHLRDLFSNLGIAHLLAISGLHFGLLACWIYGVLRLLVAKIPKLPLLVPLGKLCWALALPALFAYAGVAGLSPSVKRALIMTLTLGLAILMDRVRRLYHALALAALIILLVDPGEIFELSFQLSFLAVLGILYLLPVFTKWVHPQDPIERLHQRSLISNVVKRAVVAVGSTVSATLATLPLVVNRFHLLPVFAVPANLLFVPLIGWLVLPLTLLGAAISVAVEILGVEVLWVAAWLSDWVVRLAQWMGTWSPKIYLPSLKCWDIALFYFSVFVLVRTRWRWNLRFFAMLMCLVGVWSLMILRPHTGLKKELKVHFMAVGNGSSVLLQLPGKKNILVDGGGTHDNIPDIGSMIVAPTLWEMGVGRLHRVILTHPHPDHLNGLIFILRAFPVVEGIWDNGDRPASEAYSRFWDAALSQGKTPMALCEGDEWEIDGVRIHVLNPPCRGEESPADVKTSEANNRSLVLKVYWRGVSFLLPGDIGAGRELLLVKSKDLSATVLMAPHHGSKTSSTQEFINAVGPRFVVFSSRAGRTGLASREIIERYKRSEVLSFHTGEDGMVSFVTDGSRLRVETFRGMRRAACDLVFVLAQ